MSRVLRSLLAASRRNAWVLADRRGNVGVGGAGRAARRQDAAGTLLPRAGWPSRWLSSEAEAAAEPPAEKEAGAERPTRRRRDGGRAQSQRQRGGNRNNLVAMLERISASLTRSDRVQFFDLQDALAAARRLDRIFPGNALQLLRCCGRALVDEQPRERARLAAQVWQMLVDKQCDLDVSHYNALLKSHVENGQDFDPERFLSDMEAAGVRPNRVTFQLTIAAYAERGDLAGATDALNRMKEAGMPVNESVFHALALCQASSGDAAAARQTLDTMEQAGLLVGADACFALAAGMVRAGASVEDVMTELDRMEQQQIQLDDEGYLALALELVRAKRPSESVQSLLRRKPNKRGAFSAGRNAIPQFIYAGGRDVALQVFWELEESMPQRQERDSGLYVIRALVNSDDQAEQLIAFVEEMVEKNVNVTAFQKALEACAITGKRDLAVAIKNHASEKFGDAWDNTVDRENLRGCLRRLSSKEEATRLLATLSEVNIRVQSDLLPLLMSVFMGEAGSTTLMGAIREIEAAGQKGRFFDLVNKGLAFLLSQPTEANAREALMFVLNLPSMNWRPLSWNIELANYFVATNDLQGLISILFVTTHAVGKNELMPVDVELAFRTLVFIGQRLKERNDKEQANEKMIEILAELKKVNIGLPKKTTEELENIMGDACKPLLEELSNLFESQSEYWTEERTTAFLQERKSLIIGRSNYNPSSYLSPDQIPKDLDGLRELFRRQEKRGDVSGLLANRLVERLIESGEKEEMHDVIRKSLSFGRHFSIDVVEHVVVDLIAEGKAEEAERMVSSNLASDKGLVYSSTLVALGACWARSGQHEKVVSFLAGVDPKRVVGKRMGDLIDVYESELPDKVEEVRAALAEAGLYRESDDGSRVVNKLLAANDLDKAVEEFERMANEQKRLSAKFRLMTELIKVEDMAKIQRVLDASISVIGEQKSLYDFAHTFLSLGRVAQAKKLLETPGLTFNESKVNYILNHLKSEGNFKAMEDLVRLTRGLFGCDRGMLYRRLVDVYGEDGDKLLSLWEDMQEEGHSPSNALRRRMADLLQAAGKDVPTEFQRQTAQQ